MVISEILPAQVTSYEAFDELTAPPLFPAEEALVRNAPPQRVAEFASVRRCGRRALAKLGVPPAPILRGPGREPRWPDGVVGSMTHCAGYRAAAVAWADRTPSIGIDAEPHGPLPPEVLTRVLRPDERESLASHAARRPDLHWNRLAFSAKEAVFKAWFPLAHSRLGFHDVTLDICAAHETFRATLCPTLVVPDAISGGVLHGHWSVGAGLIVTAVVVEQARP